MSNLSTFKPFWLTRKFCNELNYFLAKFSRGGKFENSFIIRRWVSKVYKGGFPSFVFRNRVHKVEKSKICQIVWKFARRDEIISPRGCKYNNSEILEHANLNFPQKNASFGKIIFSSKSSSSDGEIKNWECIK